MNLNPLLNKPLTNKILLYLSSKGIDYSKLSVQEKIFILRRLQSSCNLCPLSKETSYRHLPSCIIPNSPIVTIGRNPTFSESEALELYPKTNHMGLMYHKYLSVLSVPYQQVSELNSFYCCSVDNKPPNLDYLRTCCAYKQLELDIIKPKLILLLGNHANYLFYGLSAPSVLHQLGSIYTYPNLLIVPLPHPNQAIMYPELFKDIEQVLLKTKELFKELQQPS